MRAQPIARDVLQERYAHAGETTVRQVRLRIARSLAAVEAPLRSRYREREFLWAQQQGFIPGGRIAAGAGRTAATLINCFVQPLSIHGQVDVDLALAQTVTTLRAGGGVGLNFSAVPPLAGGGGVVGVLQRFDAACSALATAGAARHGALMGVLAIDHPDIEAFLNAKRSGSGLHNFNLSVGIGDDFMQALARDDTLELVHATAPTAGGVRRGDGLWVYRRVAARTLWRALLDAAYAAAEPGVLFLDTIAREDNLGWCERIVATNPCGEQPLPDYGACCLGSLNLAAFVTEPFGVGAAFDFRTFEAVAAVAVRMLDNVLDLSAWPLPAQAQQARRQRRLGLGVTGLADALIMLGRRYDSGAGRACARAILRRLRDRAYATSVELARERGAFCDFDAGHYLRQPFIQRLPRALQRRIARHGIRNSHLISIAPAGSISLAFADNVANGIEPAFAWRYDRHRLLPDGSDRSYRVEDFAHRCYRLAGGDVGRLPPAFVTALQIAPEQHLRMLAALQPWVDAGIAKTVNLAPDCPRERFDSLFRQAWERGVKGLTIYRVDAGLPAVLSRACSH